MFYIACLMLRIYRYSGLNKFFVRTHTQTENHKHNQKKVKKKNTQSIPKRYERKKKQHTKEKCTKYK